MDKFHPANKDEWRNWLKENHLSADSIWVIFYKKSSPRHNMNWSDAVDQALCFGWIDSTKKSIDEETFMQYFSKRKPKSNWSRINKEKVKILIEQGLMEEAGLKSIEIAKENGSWTILDNVEALIIPEDLMEALSNQEGAFEYYESLSKSIKKGLLYWVISAKRPATRQKRVIEIVENAAQQMRPKQFR